MKQWELENHYCNDNLKGQVALVTGSSTGIGEAVVRHMAAAGADVVINTYSHPEQAEKIVAEIEETGRKAIAVQADVSQEDQVEMLFAKGIEAFGTLDILVNNAGIQQDSPLHEMTLVQWERVMNVNLTGMFLCSRAAVREFLRRGQRDVSCALGKIICMSSVHEIIPWAGRANYAASKGGVMLFMKSIAQEYGKQKIRVNSISPGAIKTNINKDAWEDPADEERLLELIPYDRVGVTDDIGRGAVWLASDEADYVHGVSLVIDGGMTLYPGFTDNG